ncbi:flavin reductase family protein [Bacillus sp. FJAT-42376]|uniref:flavin reductase family protein n=1 Tax=Bacillus sp. FJAT-42376 TaxID=2014076 RepID=UPI000F4D9949|nr:flavin reductase family protein [Bacillus sp. FJAT-42376]AZB41996.1 flavin reductase family protein [Bacillus sp. FJAT-42376]
MISICPNDLSALENYKLLIGSVIPRPIAFVTSISENDVVNGAPFSFFNIASSNPPLLTLAVQRADGKMKDTARNIISHKEFVIHVTDEENVAKINETSAPLPPDQSEIDLSGLTLTPSMQIQVPGIEEAKIRFECKLEKHLELGGTDGEPAVDFIIGRVVQYHFEDAVYKDGKIMERELAAVSRLAGTKYGKIGEIFSMERPK